MKSGESGVEDSRGMRVRSSQINLERLSVSPLAFFFFFLPCLNKNELMSGGPFEFFIYFVFKAYTRQPQIN